MNAVTRRTTANGLAPAISMRYALVEYVLSTSTSLRVTGGRNFANSSFPSSRSSACSQRQWASSTLPVKRQTFHSSTISSSRPPRARSARPTRPAHHSPPAQPTSPAQLTQPPQHSNSSQPIKYSYGIAASFVAKDKRFNPSKDVVHFKPHQILNKQRHDKKTRPASGQDAFFISQVGGTVDIAMGVADGVGGWADSGVDPADFAHGLCDYMAFSANTHNPEREPPLKPMALMQQGYDDVARDPSIKAGGSTACVAIAKPDGSLEVANLGDSGFLQLRLNAVHYYSQPQTHAFNTPYQLSLIPESMRARTRAFGGTQLCDMPKDSAVSKHDLRHGDVLVFATDGVWDNLSSSDILRTVSKLMVGAKAWSHSNDGIKVTDQLQNLVGNGGEGSNGQPHVRSLQTFLAMGIASEAKAASVNTRVDGPFAKEVQKWYPEEMWRGGKVDDICVIVAVVVEETQ